MMLCIRDLCKSCGIEVYRVEKSNVWMEVALWTTKWLKDDSKFVEFKYPHIVNSSMVGFYTTIFFLSSLYN